MADQLLTFFYSAPNSGFVESEDEEEEEEKGEAVSKASHSGGKSKGNPASRKNAIVNDSGTEKTESGSETATGGKGK